MGFGGLTRDQMIELVHWGGQTGGVSEGNLTQLPAAWACVDLIGRTFSTLPGHVLIRKGDNNEIERSHYLHSIIHDFANPSLPAAEWRRICVAHLLTWGNHYSWIHWGENNRPLGLYPIPPDRVSVERKNLASPDITYKIYNDVVPTDDILHIRGFGYDGTVGYSPVSMLRMTFENAIAAGATVSKMHKTGLTQRIVLEYPGQLDAPQADDLKKGLREAYAGLQSKDAFGAILLQKGITAKPISINPHDAQFLEGQQYSDAKIYQIFGVPPHMVGDTSKATSFGTGIESMNTGFVQYTMLPLVNMVETWLGRKLLPTGNTLRSVEYDFKGLLRGDMAARSAFYDSMTKNGAMTPNMINRLENMPTYPGGDVYQRPLNMAFVDKQGNVVQELAPKQEPKPKGGGKDAPAEQPAA